MDNQIKPLFSEVVQGKRKIEAVETPTEYVLNVELDKPLVLNLKGDVNLFINGECAIATKDENIFLDSVGSLIHLNSRLSKKMKDLPESIEYRQANEARQAKGLEQAEQEACLLCSLSERIAALERKIAELEIKRV